MLFITPADTEAAYYRAFAEGNLELMSQVWLDSPSAMCTHPMSERIVGYRLIVGGYMGMFQNQRETNIAIEQIESLQTPELCVHTGVEVIHQHASEYRMQVTNAYRATPDGWKMVLHHASPVHRVEPPSRLDSPVH